MAPLTPPLATPMVRIVPETSIAFDLKAEHSGHASLNIVWIIKTKVI